MLKKLFKDRFTYETIDSRLLKPSQNKYDIIIIDGGHQHDVCLSDLHYSTSCSNYILLDDTGGKSPGVTSALKEYTLKHPDKLSLIKKWNTGAGWHYIKSINTYNFLYISFSSML